MYLSKDLSPEAINACVQATSILQTTCKNASIIDVTSRLPSKVNEFYQLLQFRCGVTSILKTCTLINHTYY